MIDIKVKPFNMSVQNEEKLSTILVETWKFYFKDIGTNSVCLKWKNWEYEKHEKNFFKGTTMMILKMIIVWLHLNALFYAKHSALIHIYTSHAILHSPISSPLSLSLCFVIFFTFVLLISMLLLLLLLLVATDFVWCYRCCYHPAHNNKSIQQYICMHSFIERWHS